MARRSATIIGRTGSKGRSRQPAIVQQQQRLSITTAQIVEASSATSMSWRSIGMPVQSSTLLRPLAACRGIRRQADVTVARQEKMCRRGSSVAMTFPGCPFVLVTGEATVVWHETRSCW